jgi:hypothetical protein
MFLEGNLDKIHNSDYCGKHKCLPILSLYGQDMQFNISGRMRYG